MSLQAGNLQGGEVLQMGAVQRSVQRVPRVRGSRLQPVHHAVQAPNSLGALEWRHEPRQAATFMLDHYEPVAVHQRLTREMSMLSCATLGSRAPRMAAY